MPIHFTWLDKLLGRSVGSCPACAHETRLDRTHCRICGYAIVEQTKVDIARIKPI